MTFWASDMTGGQFHNLAIIFAWNNEASLGFMFVPSLMNASKTSGDMSNVLSGHQGVVHRNY